MEVLSDTNIKYVIECITNIKSKIQIDKGNNRNWIKDNDSDNYNLEDDKLSEME